MKKYIYLVVDGVLNGTGIRDLYNGGYIEHNELGISEKLSVKINLWLQKYENATYAGFQNATIIANLDIEGIEIAEALKKELPKSKIQYYSDATQKRILV